MSFLRAPFTEYEGKGGPGEVEEKARGRGAATGGWRAPSMPLLPGSVDRGGFSRGSRGRPPADSPGCGHSQRSDHFGHIADRVQPMDKKASDGVKNGF
jgi:hypothetical protein